MLHPWSLRIFPLQDEEEKTWGKKLLVIDFDMLLLAPYPAFLAPYWGRCCSYVSPFQRLAARGAPSPRAAGFAVGASPAPTLGTKMPSHRGAVAPDLGLVSQLHLCRFPQELPWLQLLQRAAEFSLCPASGAAHACRTQTGRRYSTLPASVVANSFLCFTFSPPFPCFPKWRQKIQFSIPALAFTIRRG